MLIGGDEIAVLRKVINGKPSYTKKKLAEFSKSGWRIVTKHVHPDGTTTFVLEL
jgi:hypothetical protein